MCIVITLKQATIGRYKKVSVLHQRMARFETFKAVLKARRYISNEVLYLSFEAPLSFTFTAGQFVIIKITNKGETKNRTYSILNPPSERGKVKLCAKIIDGGFASDVFKNARIGDEFEMQGPFGSFVFDEKKAEKEGMQPWLICTGAGVTPLYSMLMEHAKNNPAVSFTLLFGCRTAGDILFHDELKKLANECRNFTYLVTLSQEKWKGLQGRVQEHLPKDLNNKIFYVCGFKDMVLHTQQALKNKGVSPENIKVERYT